MVQIQRLSLGSDDVITSIPPGTIHPAVSTTTATDKTPFIVA